MRATLHRVFAAVASVVFALTTLLLMVLFLPLQHIRDGAWIFALAFLAVFIGSRVSHAAIKRTWIALCSTGAGAA